MFAAPARHHRSLCRSASRASPAPSVPMRPGPGKTVISRVAGVRPRDLRPPEPLSAACQRDSARSKHLARRVPARRLEPSHCKGDPIRPHMLRITTLTLAIQRTERCDQPKREPNCESICRRCALTVAVLRLRAAYSRPTIEVSHLAKAWGRPPEREPPSAIAENPPLPARTGPSRRRGRSALPEDLRVLGRELGFSQDLAVVEGAPPSVTGPL